MVGRVTPCAPPFANERFLIRHDGAHGVTRPTTPKTVPVVMARSLFIGGNMVRLDPLVKEKGWHGLIHATPMGLKFAEP